MAALLVPSAPTPDPQSEYGHVAETYRASLLRDPRVLAIEAMRFVAYALGRVVGIPWLIVWPSAALWTLWFAAGGDWTHVGEALARGQLTSLVWFYAVGASFHSLTVLGASPYESEVERRLEGHRTHWWARRRWLAEAGRRAP